MTDPPYLHVDPDHLRTVAARLRGYADHAGHLHAQAETGRQDLSTGDFPAADLGQRAGALWNDARPVFAEGLRLAVQMLTQTADNVTTAAARYEDTDDTAGRALRDI